MLHWIRNPKFLFHSRLLLRRLIKTIYQWFCGFGPTDSYFDFVIILFCPPSCFSLVKVCAEIKIEGKLKAYFCWTTFSSRHDPQNSRRVHFAFLFANLRIYKKTWKWKPDKCCDSTTIPLFQLYAHNPVLIILWFKNVVFARILSYFFRFICWEYSSILQSDAWRDLLAVRFDLVNNNFRYFRSLPFFKEPLTNKWILSKRVNSKRPWTIIFLAPHPFSASRDRN